MNEKLERAWKQAELTGEADVGDIVVCDLCNEDYTDSDEKGGFLFQSKGVCPKCASRFLATVRRYNEERFIGAVANDGEEFRAFILRVRSGNNKIKITVLRR